MNKEDSEALLELYRKNENHHDGCSCIWCPPKSLKNLEVDDRVLVLLGYDDTICIDRGRVESRGEETVKVWLERLKWNWNCSTKDRNIENVRGGDGFILRKIDD